MGARMNTNDPILSKVSRKLLWHEAVHASPERPAFKYFLCAIGRYFDPDASNSSMSYSQLARECGAERRTIIRYAKEAEAKGFLQIGVRMGFRHPKGRANLYHGLIPKEILPAATRAILERSSGGVMSPLSANGRRESPVLDSDNQKEDLPVELPVVRDGRWRGAAAGKRKPPDRRTSATIIDLNQRRLARASNKGGSL
jgi:hypothetical protein